MRVVTCAGSEVRVTPCTYRDNHAAGKLDPSVTFYSWPEFVSVLARYECEDSSSNFWS